MHTDLKQHLTRKRSAIVKAWSDLARETQPDGPQGGMPDLPCTDLMQGMDGLFDALLRGVIRGEVFRFLDAMIRTRVSRDFTASEAVAFIREVKRAVRKEVGNEIIDNPRRKQEVADWNSAVDDLVLFAFDIYVQSREALLEYKMNEEKAKTLRLLKKAKLISDDEE